MTTYNVVNYWTEEPYTAELLKETKCYYTVVVTNEAGVTTNVRFHKATLAKDSLRLIIKNDYEKVEAPINDREAWLTDAGEYLMTDILDPIVEDYDLDRPPVKYSVSYAPNTRTGSSTMGVCSSRAASTGGHNEIFISPELDGDRSHDVLGVLLHELIHAYLDNQDGHTGRFAKIARKVGYLTPLTQFKPSKELSETLNSYITLLGPIPHDALDYAAIKPKQKGRHLLVACSHKECPFQFRTSRKQIDLMQHSTCLICGDESLIEVDNDDH